MKIINIENWKRKEHFEFFSKMDSPFFGITTEIDCTIAHKKAKEFGYSFFAYYLHKSMVAINSVEELKYRLVDDKVVYFPTIHAGTTVARKDGTFGFVYVNYSPNFNTFQAELQKEIEGVQNSTGLRLKNEDLKKDLIRHSTIPWTSFSAILHPTSFNNKESVPKIIFGRYNEKNSKKYLPVSIEAHHGLADGLHLAMYFEKFQKELNTL